MSRQFSIMTIGMCLVALASCGLRNGKSTVQWGAMSDDLKDFLVDVRPQDLVTVCADNPQDGQTVVNAIKIWAMPIGRGQMKIELTCGGGGREVRVHSGTNGPCGGESVGCSSGKEIWITNGSSGLMANVILHEIGHQWGMCDQYPGPQNCEVNGPKGQNPDSVMGMATESNPKTQVTQDDIEGIQYLADLLPKNPRQSKANDEWKPLMNNAGTGTGMTGIGTSTASPYGNGYNPYTGTAGINPYGNGYTPMTSYMNQVPLAYRDPQNLQEAMAKALALMIVAPH